MLVATEHGSFTARTPHDTPIEPAIYHLWRTLIADGHLYEAADLCRERALVAQTIAARVCHLKDLAIVKRISGDYWGAYDLHIALAPLALQFAGAFRSRIEHGYARSLETLGEHDRALDRYTESRWHAEQGGDIPTCATVDMNTGRCLTAMREPSRSYFYFDRAEAVARQFSDFHLLGEIAESRAVAFEVEGRYAEAEESAWASVQLLVQTGDKTATAESVSTWQRLRGTR